MKKLFKSRIFFFVLGAVMFSTVSVFAYSLLAQDVGFTPKDEDWNVDNVKSGLDDLHETCDYCKSRFEGLVWKIPYEGKEQEFPVPISGIYKLEAWGAQGGDATNSYAGGYGGYSTGIVRLSNNDTLYINVGGQGTSIYHSDTVIAGGYNGGGSARSINDADVYVGAGGGATHIATSSGLLSSLENDKNSILIVAGGGGGAVKFSSDYYGVGGAGGGKQGEKATVKNVSNYTYPIGSATGGTQEAGGNYMTTCGGSQCYNSQSGSFGKGGGAINVRMPGGGGGYFGGASGGRHGGAGGSGYIASENLESALSVTKHMACYNCTTSDEEGTKTISTTNVSDDPISDYAKSGHGYAKITLLIAN
ncbi:MAG: hypothetical protein IJ572_00895 [Bacilli bacterium]|nr:hypothetical protein [Bacilli bacterium]